MNKIDKIIFCVSMIIVFIAPIWQLVMFHSPLYNLWIYFYGIGSIIFFIWALLKIKGLNYKKKKV